MGEPRLQVTEIFHSIQGESSHAGRPCTFVRLTGCQMRCRWCDTDYAFHGGEERTIDQVMASVAGFPCRLVEVTGGEPLLQPAAPLLLRRLADAGYEVMLETGGGVDTGDVDPRVTTILDVKAPGSGETERMHWPNLERLRPQDQVKFVLADRDDYDWAVARLREGLVEADRPVLFSPVHGELAPEQLAAWILEDGLEVRLQIQLHKYLWPGVERGV